MEAGSRRGVERLASIELGWPIFGDTDESLSRSCGSVASVSDHLTTAA